MQLPEQPGDPVKVVGGLLMGASGLFAGMRGDERVAILLAVLGRVTLLAGDVEPAG